jgi:filamentous hemagglutinin
MGSNEPMCIGKPDEMLFTGGGGRGGASAVSKEISGKATRPPNMSPEGAGRNGAFREAKRQAGIPVGQNPSNVYPNVDKRGNSQPGLIYEFDVPKSGGGTAKVYIRDDAGGHSFGSDNPQNRGAHFNDPKGNHYDY